MRRDPERSGQRVEAKEAASEAGARWSEQRRRTLSYAEQRSDEPARRSQASFADQAPTYALSTIHFPRYSSLRM